MPNMDFTRLGLLAQAAVVLCIAVPASNVAWTWKKALILFLMIACGSVVFFCLFLLVASAAFLVPLALIQYYPLLYLLDKETGVWYMAAPLLALLFLIPSCLFYRFGLRHYQSAES